MAADALLGKKQERSKAFDKWEPYMQFKQSIGSQKPPIYIFITIN